LRFGGQQPSSRGGLSCCKQRCGFSSLPPPWQCRRSCREKCMGKWIQREGLAGAVTLSRS
jgi:hypothetical protein